MRDFFRKGERKIPIGENKIPAYYDLIGESKLLTCSHLYAIIDTSNQREVCSMKKDMDCIQFESRRELEELMQVIDKYVKQNPAEKNNKTLERFFNLLDVMHMEW